MGIPEAVKLIFEAGNLMLGGEIFVLKMKRRPIVEFAQEAILTHGNGQKIDLVFIGLRPGEKLHETLLTEEEAPRTLENDEMLIIIPENVAHISLPSQTHNYPGARTLESMEYVHT